MRNYDDKPERRRMGRLVRPARLRRPLPDGAAIVAVEHVFHREGRELATVRVTRGEADPGMIATAVDGSQWRLLALGTVSASEWARGRRTLTLAPLAAVARPLARGEILSLSNGEER